MGNQKRRIYFSSLQIRQLLSYELLENRDKIKSVIFDPIIEKYNVAIKTGNFSDFQRKIENGQEIFMVSMLHYEDNVLCGIISHGTPSMERYLRECNPLTFNVKELTPSKGNVFEEYSFFAISISKMQMAYLSDPAVSSNIPTLTLHLLRPVINSNYEFEECCLLETDIKKKIKELGNSVSVKGILVGKEEQIIGGLASIKTLQKSLGTKFSATVTVKARLKKKLTDEDINTIKECVTQDDGFSSFTFSDERDVDKEVIDVIKNHVRFSKKIELSTDERKSPSSVWNKLCNSFAVGEVK